jgi:hypothetical protein
LLSLVLTRLLLLGGVLLLILLLSCSQDLGQPGSFEGQYQHEHYSVAEATEGLDSHVLYGKESLIGQLAPGLRLCLAAEVATGLLCDRWGFCWLVQLVLVLVLLRSMTALSLEHWTLL